MQLHSCGDFKPPLRLHGKLHVPMQHRQASGKEEAARLTRHLVFACIDHASFFDQLVVLLLDQCHGLTEFNQTLVKVFADVVPPAGVANLLIVLLDDYQYLW